MNLRSLTSLAICTATVTTASTLWANPAHAILLRFTGLSVNSTSVTFDYDSGPDGLNINELEPVEESDPYLGVIKNLNVSVDDSSNLRFFLEDAPLLVSPISSTTLDLLDDDPSDFLNLGSGGIDGDNEYIINFEDVPATFALGPEVTGDTTISGSYTFIFLDGITEGGNESVGILELDYSDLELDASELGLSFAFLDPITLNNVSVEREEVTSVPEAQSYVGLGLIGVLGIMQLGRKRFKAS